MSSTALPVIYRQDGKRDAKRCRECGGTCCKQVPGITWPSDFFPHEQLQEILESYLRTGYWSVDWWEGDPRDENAVPIGERLSCVYYLRPATVFGKGKLRDPSWGGQCVFWTQEHGCGLMYQNRPHECRHLNPASCTHDNPEESGISKQQTCIEWIPYQAQIIAALENVERDHS